MSAAPKFTHYNWTAMGMRASDPSPFGTVQYLREPDVTPVVSELYAALRTTLGIIRPIADDERSEKRTGLARALEAKVLAALAKVDAS